MKKNILILSGVAWNATYQRHQLNAKILSELGYNVDFLESCKTSKITIKKIFETLKIKFFYEKGSCVENEIPKSVKVITSNLLPPMGLISKLLNKIIFKFSLSQKIKSNYDVIIYYTPSDHFDLITKANFIVYDCVRAFSLWGGYHKSLMENEKKLIKMADLVLCDSFYLKDVHLPAINKSSNIFHLLPPIDKNNNVVYSPRKILTIGYFGSISEHIDVKLLSELISYGFKVKFWGVDSEGLLPADVIDYGYISDQDQLLLSLVQECDCLIIPYNRPLDGVYPAKLALSMSSYLPVFSSAFYDSKKLGHLIYLYHERNELLKLLREFDPYLHVERLKLIEKYIDDNSFFEYKNKLQGLINESV